jgi:NADH-quinone oxidoreductase subunit J
MPEATLSEWVLSSLLVISSLGVVLARKPVHACLWFLVTLLTLASLYLQLSAEFIAVMQVLVYAGAILVIFMFVIILFQDAHQQIESVKGKSSNLFLLAAGTFFALVLIYFGKLIVSFPPSVETLPKHYGSAEALGKLLYVDFFFPFEAVILLFLIAVIGALYVARKAVEDEKRENETRDRDIQ